MEDFFWVRSNADLEERMPRWLQQPFVAIDTEFERTNTYFARAGLIQIADDRGVALIDPLEVPQLEGLGPLLTSDTTHIVMHSMSEDVELLRHITGRAPTQVFDTQIAASFLGLGSSLGYQALVKEVLDVELDKSETRSDWLQRPLSDTQISYAVKDARFLCALYHDLVARLEEAGLSAACLEETRITIEQVTAAWQHPELAYLKLRGAWHLPPEQQFQLRALVQWRDLTAQSKNKPKPWIFADAILIQIVERQPQKANELNRIKGIGHKSAQKYGDEVIALLQTSLDAASDPEQGAAALTLIDGPIKGAELDLYRQLKKIVSRVSEQSGISAQLLGSRKMLEQVVIDVLRKKQGRLPEVFQGWRADYLAVAFKAGLAEAGALID